MNSNGDPVSVLKATQTYFKQRHLGCDTHFGSFISYHISCRNKDTKQHDMKNQKINMTLCQKATEAYREPHQKKVLVKHN